MINAKMALVLTSLAGVLMLGATSSSARDYPFCRKGEGGPGDCRYDTYEQCLAAVSQTVGTCQPNYWLPPAGRNVPPPRARRAVG